MNANIQTITLDLTNSAFSAAQKVSVVQGDSGTRPVKAIITDNGVVRTDLYHESARLYISNAKGERPTYVEGISINGGIAEFSIPQSATLQPGIKNGELRLVDKDEKVLSSMSFMVEVTSSQYDVEALLGTDDGDVLERMVEQAEKILKDCSSVYISDGKTEGEPPEGYDIWIDTNEDYPQNATNIPTATEYFDIDANGVVFLKPKYRGRSVNDAYHLSISDKGVGLVGSKAFCLPSKIVIPETIGGVTVTGLAEGMFAYNNYVEEIVIPDTVSVIPNQFCYNAHQLKIIANTEYITEIGDKAFSQTRIEEALFPNLTAMGNRAFSKSVFLHTIDIGDVEQIDEAVFSYCRSLKTIYGGDNVKTICAGAFYHTTALKTVSFLNKLNVTEIKDTAFVCSNVRFDWSALTNCTFGSPCSTPISDNSTDFWSGIDYSAYACENRLGTLFNQSDTRWKDISFERTNKTWSNCCGVFSTLHIHSALSGNSYNTPMEYETKLLAAVDAAKKEAQTDEEKQAIEDALSVESSYESEIIYNVLGYEAQRICSGDTCIDSVIFKTMLSALTDGVYAHLSISSLNDSDNDGVLEGHPNGGHAVIAYGVTENGEIMIADSASGSASVGASNEMLTYQIPLQNIMGEQGDIVIVKNKTNNT